MKYPSTHHLGVLVLLFSFLGRAIAADTAPAIPETEVIKLPTYDITTDRVLPPIEKWQYISIPGFEILSNASEHNTKAFVEDFYLLRQVAQIVMPGLKESTSVPTYIVLCGEGDAFQAFMPNTKRRAPASLYVRDNERSAIIINFTFQSPDGQVHDRLSNGGNDPFRNFYLQYFRQLIHKSVEPAPPKWLEEGLVQIFSAIDFSPKTIVIGQVSGEASAPARQARNGGVLRTGTTLGTRYNPSGYSDSPFNSPFDSSFQQGSPGKVGSFNAILTKRSLLPLERFFSYDQNTPPSEEFLVYNAQAYLFSHLCLYGRAQRFTKSFFKLAQKASQGPVTEAVFQECFGMPFKEMEAEMRSYITMTDYTSIERHLTKGDQLALAPKLKIRDATDAESSRIAGEVLRLAGQKQEAINRLIAPYVRGQYDADLLAALGLAELSTKHIKRGRRFLEGAIEANTSRTRAYVELAKMRMQDIQEKTTAEKRDASASEYAWIQAPLYQGLKHPPAMASLYDLLTRTWYLSPSAPTKEQFEELAAGAQQNYKDLGLVFRVAALGVKHGHIETSRRFVEFGLANSPDPSTKAKFEQLAKELPPADKPASTEPAATIPSAPASS